MRIGIPREIMPFQIMEWLKKQLEKHANITWYHKPSHPCSSIMLSEGDACQPFKSMIRTSVALLPEVDTLLVPRIVGLDGHLMCPNFRALPDIIRLNVKKICPQFEEKINDTVIDIKDNTAYLPLIHSLGESLLCTEVDPSLICIPTHRPSVITKDLEPFADKTIALLGHPYLLEDDRLNNGIVKQLERLGYTVTTPTTIPFQDLDQLAKQDDYYAKTNYWRSSRETLGAFRYYTEHKRPTGIIYLISFNCGVDALMRIELMSFHSKLKETIPFMVLVGDEHTQQEHTATRIEAYLDIINGI